MISLLFLMSKTKYPNLYSIVKKDEIEMLQSFIDANPNYDFNQRLPIGKHLRILEVAVKFSSIKCITYLIELVPPESLSYYITTFIKTMKKDNDHDESYELYYNTVTYQILNNKLNVNILSDLLYWMLRYRCVNEKYINALLYNNLFDFIQRMEDIEYKFWMETHIVSNKTYIIQLFINYYIGNHMDLSSLYKRYLTHRYDKIKAIDTMFNSCVDIKTKVKLNNYKHHYDGRDQHDIITYAGEYSLSTLLYFSSDNETINKEITQNPLFETELLNLFQTLANNCTHDSLDFTTKHFHRIISYARVNPYLYQNAFYEKLLEPSTTHYLSLVKNHLTDTFWNWLRELNNKCSNELFKKQVNDEINKLSNQIIF